MNLARSDLAAVELSELLLASSYRVDTPDAGVTPDIVVQPQFKLRAAGRDEEMDAVMKATR